MVAGEVSGGIGLAGQQRAQAGVDTHDVIAGDLAAYALVYLVQNVVNIGLGRRRIRQGETLFPIGIGGTDDPVLAPWDNEEDGLFGDEAQGCLCIKRILGHNDVHALGGVNGELALHAGHLLNLVIPHAGGVDKDLAAHGGLAAGGGIANLRAYDAAAAVLVKANDLGIGTYIGTILGGGTQHGHGVAGVINQSVVVAHAAHNGIVLQARGHLQHTLAGEVLLHWHALRAAHEVIKSKATEHHHALPYVVGQREDELQWLHQVGCQGRHIELALLEGLRH